MARPSLGAKNGSYIFEGLVKQTNKQRIFDRDYLWLEKLITFIIWLFTKRLLLTSALLKAVGGLKEEKGGERMERRRIILKILRRLNWQESWPGGGEWENRWYQGRIEVSFSNTQNARERIKAVIDWGPTAVKHPQDVQVEMLRRHIRLNNAPLLCYLWYKFLKGKDNATAYCKSWHMIGINQAGWAHLTDLDGWFRRLSPSWVWLNG